MVCQECIDKWGAEPSIVLPDSVEEIEARKEHVRDHGNVIAFTGDELNALHELMLVGIRDETLPECTWTDDCTACQLIDKITNKWIEWRDRT